LDSENAGRSMFTQIVEFHHLCNNFRNAMASVISNIVQTLLGYRAGSHEAV
jgi:hypothetical protein